MKKAYFDLVEEKLTTEPLDYAWVVQLYDEIKFKLIGILKPDSELRNDIEDRMDTELFEQMIRHRAFDYRDLRQLVNYVFDKILSLCAPVRDPDVKAMLDELNEMMDNEMTIPQVLTKYIEYANDGLDTIYDDLGVVLNGLQNENPNLRSDGMDRQSDGGSF
jgi:hypothetical protein